MIGSSENRVSYNGNDVTTEFPFAFKILEATDLKLLLVEADGTENPLTSDYFVDMNKSVVFYPGYSPGTEPPASEQPPKLTSGQRLVIYREVPITQESALDEHWPFNVIEAMADKLTIICQQLADSVSRSFRVSNATDKNVDTTIPVSPGKSFRWSDDAKKLEVTEDPARVLPLAQSTLNETIAAKNEAQGYSANADAKAEQAANSAINAAASETNASNSADLARAWAESETSPDGNTDSRSAKWWAEYGENAVKGIDESVIVATQKASEASNFAQASANSAQASLTSADEAKASELAAKASETNTKISEASALQSASVSAQKASEASNFAGNAKSSEDNAKASETNAAKSAEEALKAKEEAVAGQIQADWNETNTDSKAFIKNKPGIMKGASNANAGTSGLVPAPSAGAKNRYLNAYGEFEEISIPVTSVNGKTGDVVVDLEDLPNVMQAVEQVQTSVGTLEQSVGTAIDYIIESYRNGTEWYEVYKSGKVRQGGISTSSSENVTITLLKEYLSVDDYTVIGIAGSGSGGISGSNNDSRTFSKTTTSFRYYKQNNSQFEWVAEGQGV